MTRLDKRQTIFSFHPLHLVLPAAALLVLPALASCDTRRDAPAQDSAASAADVKNEGDAPPSDLTAPTPDTGPPPDQSGAPDASQPDGPVAPLCKPWEANKTGTCGTTLGYKWNGNLCLGVKGCSCSGKHCKTLHSTLAACKKTHAACRSCMALNAAGQGPCDMLLGVTWTGTGCKSLSGCSCKGKECGKLFKNKAACEAAHKYCLPCTAMDATGWGLCTADYGYKWDGTKCQLVNCNCKGKDCALVVDVTKTECKSYFAHCM